MASDQTISDEFYLPSYEEAMRTPAHSTHPDNPTCPSYEDSLLNNALPPPPYSAGSTQSRVLQLPHSFWAQIGGLSQNSTDVANGNGNTSALSDARCTCTQNSVLGYTHSVCKVHEPDNRGTEENGQLWDQDRQLCCRKNELLRTYGFLFPCESNRSCPCEGAGTCRCVDVTALPSSHSPSISCLARQACHRVRQWLST